MHFLCHYGFSPAWPLKRQDGSPRLLACAADCPGKRQAAGFLRPPRCYKAGLRPRSKRRHSSMALAKQFDQVTVVCKANVYFDGKVISHTVLFADGSRKTLGLI